MDIFDRLSRRRLLRHGAGTLLAAGLWPGALRAGDAAPPEDFAFVVLNDLHYLNKNCTPFHEGVVAQIKAHKEKPELCLIVGDLAENGTPEQFDPVRTIYRGLGLPVHVVVGNHDYVKDTDRKTYENLFPGSINYTFEHRGWQWVGLDSTAGQNGTAPVPKDTLTWVDEHLPKMDKKKPLILFTHFPLGPFVVRRSTNAEELLKRFKDHNLQAIYNGHFHCLTESPVNGVIATTNRCCSFSHRNHFGSQQKGYFLCQVKGGKIMREFVEFKLA
jgi:calcineurin-like phosphoesterase family protein